jgi:hypothetical protein
MKNEAGYLAKESNVRFILQLSAFILIPLSGRYRPRYCFELLNFRLLLFPIRFSPILR